MTQHEEKAPIEMSIAEIKASAAALARQMKSDEMTHAVRARFINVRAALFQRGVYDPILVRFDSATVARASLAEIGDELEKVASNL